MDLVQELNQYLKNAVPTYKRKDRVWIIWDKNKSVEGVRIFTLIYQICGSDNGDILVHTGYRLDNPALEPRDYYPHELYASKEEADRHAVWHAVKEFSEEEWDAAIGNLEKINLFNEGLFRGELVKDLPPNEFMTCFGTFAERNPIEALLHQCRAERGLIERDRLAVERMITSACPCCAPNWQDYPLLHRLLKSLHLDDRRSSPSDAHIHRA